jgi:uncharacterized MAPEG superfamily protein
MTEMHLMAVRSTAVLSITLWTKVAVTNLGLGGTKANAGGRAPEDTYQKKTEEISPEALATLDRSQRIVNNDLENIPYTMVLAWGAIFCIFFGGDADFRDSQAAAHIALFTIFVAARVAHSVCYALGLSIPRSVVWATGFLCSFGIGINGAIAAFKIQ